MSRPVRYIRAMRGCHLLTLLLSISIATLQGCENGEGGNVQPLVPEAVVRPEAIDFGSVLIGSERRVVVEIESVGTAALELLDIQISGAGFSTDGAPVRLAPTEIASVTVVFSPTTNGEHEGEMVVPHNGSEALQPLTIALSGTGVVAATCESASPCERAEIDPLSGLCVRTHREGACDDESACTENDRCVEGECIGTPIVCDDEVDCTVDTCDRTAGCIAIPVHTRCDAPRPCMDGRCDLQGCSEVPRPDYSVCGVGVECEVSLVCLDAECRALSLFDGSPCDDENSCTTGDACLDGVCQGTPPTMAPRVVGGTTLIDSARVFSVGITGADHWLNSNELLLPLPFGLQHIRVDDVAGGAHVLNLVQTYPDLGLAVSLSAIGDSVAIVRRAVGFSDTATYDVYDFSGPTPVVIQIGGAQVPATIAAAHDAIAWCDFDSGEGFIQLVDSTNGFAPAPVALPRLDCEGVLFLTDSHLIDFSERRVKIYDRDGTTLGAGTRTIDFFASDIVPQVQAISQTHLAIRTYAGDNVLGFRTTVVALDADGAPGGVEGTDRGEPLLLSPSNIFVGANDELLAYPLAFDADPIIVATNPTRKRFRTAGRNLVLGVGPHGQVGAGATAAFIRDGELQVATVNAASTLSHLTPFPTHFLASGLDEVASFPREPVSGQRSVNFFQPPPEPQQASVLVVDDSVLLANHRDAAKRWTSGWCTDDCFDEFGAFSTTPQLATTRLDVSTFSIEGQTFDDAGFEAAELGSATFRRVDGEGCAVAAIIEDGGFFRSSSLWYGDACAGEGVVWLNEVDAIPSLPFNGNYVVQMQSETTVIVATQREIHAYDFSDVTAPARLFEADLPSFAGADGTPGRWALVDARADFDAGVLAVAFTQARPDRDGPPREHHMLGVASIQPFAMEFATVDLSYRDASGTAVLDGDQDLLAPRRRVLALSPPRVFVNARAIGPNGRGQHTVRVYDVSETTPVLDTEVVVGAEPMDAVVEDGVLHVLLDHGLATISPTCSPAD